MQPQIGMWWAFCCLHDLHEITTAADLAEVRGWHEDEIRLWPSLEAALAELLPDEDAESRRVLLAWEGLDPRIRAALPSPSPA